MSGQTREQSCNIAGGKAGVVGEGREHSDINLSTDPLKGLAQSTELQNLHRIFQRRPVAVRYILQLPPLYWAPIFPWLFRLSLSVQ